MSPRNKDSPDPELGPDLRNCLTHALAILADKAPRAAVC